MNPERKYKLSVPQDLYEKIGDKEKTIELIRTGLLSLRVTSLENEIADLIEKTGQLRKHASELPYDIMKMKELLREVGKDQRTLETMLNKIR